MTLKEKKKILDNKLKIILKHTIVSWDNVNKIKEINNALKSQFDMTKMGVINKYNEKR